MAKAQNNGLAPAMFNQFQQGDVTVEYVDAIPEGATPVTEGSFVKGVLMVGEGHHQHQLTLDGVTPASHIEQFEKDGIRYAKLTQPVTLSHLSIHGGAGEHKSIALKEGIIKIGQVNEYNYLEQMSRKVID